MPLTEQDVIDLRPYAELDPTTSRIVALAYAQYSKDEPATREHLAFHAKTSIEMVLNAERELSLLREWEHPSGHHGLRPSLRGLTYIPEAFRELQLLDDLIRLAHDRYRPDQNRMEGSEVARELHVDIPILKHLAPFARELNRGLQPTTGDLFFQFDHQKERSLREAFARQVLRTEPTAATPYSEPEAAFLLRLRSLRAVGFRALRSVDLELNPVTVLVGANGVGKSTILDALLFLARAAARGLPSAIFCEAGFDKLRTRGTTGSIELKVEFQVDYGPGRSDLGSYSIAFADLHGQTVVESERLVVAAGGEQTTFIDGRRGRATVLGPQRTPHTLYLEPDALALVAGPNEVCSFTRQFAAALADMKLVDRDFQRTSPGEFLPVAKGVVQSVIDTGRQRLSASVRTLLHPIALEPELTQRLGEYLHELVPAIRAVRRDIGPDQIPFLQIEEEGGLYGLDEVSGGIRQLLLIAGLCLNNHPPAVTLLEEPDAVIHVGAQPVLIDLLHTLARKSLVIATSHSPTFVGRLDPRKEVQALQRSGPDLKVMSLAEALSSSEWLRQFGSPAEAFTRSALREGR